MGCLVKVYVELNVMRRMSFSWDNERSLRVSFCIVLEIFSERVISMKKVLPR